ncbi:DUF2911 domain-containing protein [Hymenobacter sp. DH14]|uniref:DUF2911 domain-containing protein n=1 Tax=Hymenobacter cyanobacteriorum TaxID=2926463 RepID=A0A9X1VC60_9BACT|nr:DUF2911 domain-containing protein [Hymenobacter cyanobacteriorum]MCI1186151.1 DUF2911 domain-containing protein [Hymenobacter cyanobacteriorum]
MSKHFAPFSVAVATAATLLAAPAAQAQIRTPAASPLSTVSQRVGLTDITITYSRPGVKARNIFGTVVPFGKRWRTGANGTTSIKFSDDVMIEGKKVAAGEYGIYTIPNKTEWMVVLNKSLKQGADVDGFKDDQDVARFTIKPYKVASKVETFTINFTDITPATANVAMEWENTGAKFKVTADVDTKVMAQIDEKITKAATPAPGDLAAAAVYYYDNNKDLKQALAWMEKANAAEPTKFWNLNTEAKIRLKMKDYAGATKAAEASKKAALAATPPNGEYVKMNEDLMAEAKKMGK